MLGRTPKNLSPESGNPKLDLVKSLAAALDWSIGDVAEALAGSTAEAELSAATQPFDEIDARCVTLHTEGRYSEVISLARVAYATATTPEQRGIAKQREFSGYDGMGRYAHAAASLREGLTELGLPARIERLLRVNLAHCVYVLGHLAEARGLAREVLNECADPELTDADQHAEGFRAVVAHAHAALGQAYRAGIPVEARAAAVPAAREAAEHLKHAEAAFTALHKDLSHPNYLGLARVARFGWLETASCLGEVRPEDAIAELLAAIGAHGPGTDTSSDEANALGWGCVYACNIARRHLAEREMHRALGIFTNKGYEIADRLGDWSLRERLFAIEFLQRSDLAQMLGRPLDWTIDEEEIRVIVGTMGRFPGFRPTGWKILETAKLVRRGKGGGL